MVKELQMWKRHKPVKFVISNCEVCPYFEVSKKVNKFKCFHKLNLKNNEFEFENVEDYKNKYKQMFQNCPLDDE